MEIWEHVCTLGSRMDSIMVNTKSRVKREFHALFRESLLVNFLWLLDGDGRENLPCSIITLFEFLST